LVIARNANSGQRFFIAATAITSILALPSAKPGPTIGCKWWGRVAVAGRGSRNRIEAAWAASGETSRRPPAGASALSRQPDSRICVLDSAFDASNLSYRMRVLADLVRGTDPELEDTAVKIVSPHVGLVADSTDLLRCWRDQRQPASATSYELSEAF
jgi:hypothetical protein